MPCIAQTLNVYRQKVRHVYLYDIPLQFDCDKKLYRNPINSDIYKKFICHEELIRKGDRNVFYLGSIIRYLKFFRERIKS